LTTTTAIYPLSLHDALPIFPIRRALRRLKRYRDISRQATGCGFCRVVRRDFLFFEWEHLPSSTREILRFVLKARRCHISYLVYRDRKSTRLNSSHVKISYAV